MSILQFLRGRTRVTTAVLVLALVAGCGTSSKKPIEPEVPVAPTPNSPQNALKLLEWSWDQRDTTAYRNVFTDDFVYAFAPSDSQSIGVAINRTEELAIAENLFSQGGPLPGKPAATSIVFGLDNLLVATDDDRPGKSPVHHKRIATNVRLIVNTPGTDYSTSGAAVFYVTRGDSALIPADMAARGFIADPTRWYVDRWSDVTACPDGKSCVTVGKVKIAYAEGPLAPVRAGR